MFCPECEAEYKPGFTQCSDCNVSLVSALAPEERDCSQHQGQVAVFVTRDMVEAETVRELLVSNGIEVCVSGESSPLPGVTAEFRLLVNQSQAELANEILEEFSEEEGEEGFGKVLPFPSH